MLFLRIIFLFLCGRTTSGILASGQWTAFRYVLQNSGLHAIPLTKALLRQEVRISEMLEEGMGTSQLRCNMRGALRIARMRCVKVTASHLEC